ncbi:MAG: Orotate phosphoribosyltransferase [uncultured Thermomicrobiales bacterium]|uniref:Orotate phosphoribosyltransferase n=1 Tax=uncultured Thermomicrobiales bacterium TaxID=1645740 RepID=A0A6J4U641_9BACT|nr:MAG: Orotate phosphoribosyltransferase [uncultured Thermomicrobiales bacterium]
MSRDVLAILQSIGALKQGHFLFSSGRHGDVYLEKFDLFRNPVAASDVCTGFVDRFRNERIDVVVGPTTGGILMAFETARQLAVAAAFAERSSETGTAREFRRGTTFEPGSRVLLLDDILTTGGSVRETLAALDSHPVEVVAVGVLVDRSGGNVTFGEVPLFALSTQDIASWNPADCPMCREGQPLTKPGTTAVAST